MATINLIIIKNIYDSSHYLHFLKQILPTTKLNYKQEIMILKSANEELVKKVKSLEKLVPINKQLTERVQFLENLVQELQTLNKIEIKTEEVYI